MIGGNIGISVGKSETILLDNGLLDDLELSTEDNYETLEMQLRHTYTPKKNPCPTKKNIFQNPSIQEKIKANSKQRSKSIIEPRKFFQPYKIIGGEGEENSEFKHPLGDFFNFM